MKKMCTVNKILFGLILIIAMLSCSSNIKKSCGIKRTKTLFVIPGIYEGKTTGYTHYVLVEGLFRSCIDSVMMVDLALKYMDTVKVGKPADIIMFFNSDKEFIPNETSQVMEEINRNCLVVINFNVSSKKPTNFIFYNEKGERIYWGKRWLPTSDL